MPTLAFHDVQRAFLQGTRALPGTRTFLQLSGAGMGSLGALGNDFTDAQIAIARDNDVPADAVSEQRI
jgi:hypothetical protein